ncbi:MAG: hypothetical protein ISR90_06495 [Candidatus Marinimicrobia bacterium]|nr:hypothetical protein [Candidatus Neomarinimicrobiota bacterium]MBL7023680.1 hypothetical protein [Candidatus Neomarinimicrobiota bacterium]
MLMKNNFLKTTAVFVFALLLILVSCEKIPPLSDNLSDELDFTCESCHINEAVLAQLAPDTGEDAGGGGG